MQNGLEGPLIILSAPGHAIAHTGCTTLQVDALPWAERTGSRQARPMRAARDFVKCAKFKLRFCVGGPTPCSRGLLALRVGRPNLVLLQAPGFGHRCSFGPVARPRSGGPGRSAKVPGCAPWDSPPGLQDAGGPSQQRPWG